MIVWTLGTVLAVLVIGGVALQVAIARNGPAVLSTVDRVAGGSRGAEILATASTGDHAQQKLIVWGPERRDPADAPLPVLLFVHGGSWRNGDPVDYGFIGRAFVPEGFIVVLVGYRLAEDGIYPAMIEDTASAVAWAHRNIARHGGDPDRIVLAGHSAGAYNVAMTALEEKWLGAHGLSDDQIAGVVGLAGPYEFLPFSRGSTEDAFGHVAEPEITQPVNHVRADGPQMLLVHGEADELVKPRNTRALESALRARDGHALSLFLPDGDHNQPLLSLAAPWRGRDSVFEMVAGFAKGVTAEGETSVPVKAETR